MSSRTEPPLVVAAALVDNLARPTRLLAARRTEPPELAGRWEFPGGKVEAGESPVPALRRELLEELGVRVSLGDEITGPDGGAWPVTRGWVMRVWWAVPDGRPLPLEDHDELRWLARDDLDTVLWLDANAAIVAAVSSSMSSG